MSEQKNLHSLIICRYMVLANIQYKQHTITNQFYQMSRFVNYFYWHYFGITFYN